MPLDASQIKETMRLYAQQVFVAGHHTANVDTDAIEAAITGLVTFIEANTGAINNALPQPFKSAASTEEKRHLVALVAAKLANI